jgi:hypothetical protein
MDPAARNQMITTKDLVVFLFRHLNIRILYSTGNSHRRYCHWFRDSQNLWNRIIVTSLSEISIMETSIVLKFIANRTWTEYRC